jgi:pantothenate kinase type III
MINRNAILLEIGNSTIKVAHVGDDGAIRLERYSNVEALLRRCESAAESLVVAPVGKELSDEVMGRLENVREVEVIDRARFAEFIAGSYDTPETLGLDRILNLAGLGGDGIVISCGTAITVDAVAGGHPVWGAIMPGFRTAAEGLNARVPALPLVPLDDETGLPARSSRRSVANGVLLGTALAAEGLARRLAETASGSDSPRVVITGGDGDLLARLWSGPAPEVDEVLLFRGMMGRDEI